MTTQINPATQVANGTLPAGVIAASAAPVSYTQTVSISANTVLTAAQSGTVFVTAAALTVTLPVLAIGLRYRIYGCQNGVVTILPNAGGSIYFPDFSSAASFAMPLNTLGFIDLVCDGSNWRAWTSGRMMVANAVNANEAVALGQVFGIGQSHVNVTASRALATTYTNSTGRPIWVIAMFASNAGTIVSFYINAVLVESTGTPTLNSQVIFNQCVLPGEAYSYAVISGASSVSSWWEIR